MRTSTSRRLTLGVGFLGLAALTLMAGRSSLAAKPPTTPAAAQEAAPAAAPEASSDYSRRVVAYIYGNVPITREELGEYLIARHGADRLPNLVNKRVIEHACRQKGIEVTAAEVEAGLEEDLKGLNVNRKDFVEKVLKQYNKTLYEWKEDVIRPRLLMTKLCRDRVKVTEEEIQMAYEAYYGEKVECRLILWQKGEERAAMRAYEKIRSSEEEFDRESRKQASPTLASTGGRIRPIGRHTTGNPELEKAAFSLEPGELSQIIDTPEGPCVLRCVGKVAADKSKKLEEARAELEKEVFDKKVQQEIKVVFQELRDQAQVKLILKAYTSEEELLQDIREEIRSDRKSGAAVPAPKSR